MKSKELTNPAFYQQNLRNSLPLTQSKSGPDLKLMKQFIARI